MKLATFGLLALSLSLGSALSQAADPLHRFVDPTIGTENYGAVTVGPARPFGMVKPGPDNRRTWNSGYVTDKDAAIYGFSQLHVSGTGGGPKYGNVTVMPFVANFSGRDHASLHADEKVELGYYATTLEKHDIRAELTAASKVAFYRFSFKGGGERGIQLDAGEFLNPPTQAVTPGEENFPKEFQHLVGSEIEVLSDTEVRGHQRVRGGWNRGGAYTVFFHAVFDQPFRSFSTWKQGRIESGVRLQVDSGMPTGALLNFGHAARGAARPVQMKIGISFISTAKARANIAAEVPGWSFEDTLNETRAIWERALSRVAVSPDASLAHKRMLYTALYRTQLMPADRSGENPLWHSGEPYYDDFYAIWDTFRTSHPLITLLEPQRQSDIVRSLIDIHRHDGYMPDARSGNANGRTQGGSNADVLIADAYVKRLPGIDYEAALQAMLKNADVPPGGDEQAHGRGGLADYNTLGYVSTRFPRSGTRTVEYAYNDFAIATVARGLGKTELFNRFERQSNNWKNLWRDITSHGATGFVMPKDANGQWVDQVTCTEPDMKGRTPRYLPTTADYGNCQAWWSGVFYEGSSWEYSLFVPHDVAGLIEKSGGPAAFEQRLDTLFDNPLQWGQGWNGNVHYTVSNEPSFLSPSLYHWIGKPELSTRRVRDVVARHYNDGRGGIPGNDDSGAMSSWLAFHLMGLFPNAGQSYYLIHAPFFRQTRLNLPDGRVFEIRADGLSAQNTVIRGARLNGQPLPRAWIEHREITAGGVLELDMGDAPAGWGRTALPPSRRLD